IGFPIAAIMYRKEIESWGPGDHIGTFRSNQVSIAAGNGAFHFINDYEVEQHTKEMGAYLMNKLNECREAHPAIGEVRGAGLMIGIEYIKDPVTRAPDAEIVKKIRQHCFENGLLFEVGGHYNNVIRFLPPLIINRAIIDNAMAIFENAHRVVTEEAVHYGVSN
ncbi:MAG TPA: aminotransferase class III-fold pyridoxal phosphate-dependent enzyme, partial [Chitinophagaceae bacterium]|nr:aminotransferase class III-fold pyridoxal phosphate-dependent enzyme [Chitinophagaceae bacterium]